MAKGSDNPFPSILVVEGSTPASPGAGDQRLFINSSTHHLERVNSSGSVTDIETAAAGVTQLDSQTVGTAVSSITIPPSGSLSGSYSMIEVVFMGRGSNASNPNVQVTVNSDTGTNYDLVNLYGNNSTTASTNSGTGAANWVIATIPGSSATANIAGSFRIRFPFYAATTFFKTILAETAQILGETASSNYIVHISGQWRSTSAITTITLTASAGNFITGSKVVTYGYT